MSDLHHYASQYYDPVKAHEYYMRNRELKGRTTTGMSDEQREAWKVTKSNITSEKRSKLDAAQQERQQKIEATRQRAIQMREQISAKLAKLAEKLQTDKVSEREKISAKIQAEIDNLPPIPRNISTSQRNALIKKRQAEIAKIRGQGDSELQKLDQKYESEKSSLGQKREKVRVELKNKVAEARESYKKARESINADYEKIYQREYDNIKASIPGKAKTRKRSTTNEDSKV